MFCILDYHFSAIFGVSGVLILCFLASGCCLHLCCWVRWVFCRYFDLSLNFAGIVLDLVFLGVLCSHNRKSYASLRSFRIQAGVRLLHLANAFC